MPQNPVKSTVAARCGLIFCALAFLAACSSADALNWLVSGKGYRLESGLRYGPEREHALDVYIPDRFAPARPVVIFFYGGAWKSGDKEKYRFVGQALSRLGYLVAIPDYRLYPFVHYPRFLQDNARAVAWVRENATRYGGNPERIFLMGHSAGAYNAMMLALDDRWLGEEGGNTGWIRGAVGLAGPYDFLPMDEDVRKIFENALDLNTTQPVFHVRDGAPPVLLLTGGNDEQVEPRNSESLAAALTAKGNEAKVITYPGMSHLGIILALSPVKENERVLRDVARFIGGH